MDLTQAGISPTFEDDLIAATNLADSYRSAVQKKRGVKTLQKKILATAQRFEHTSTAYRVLIGSLFEPLSDTLSRDEYIDMCKQFGRTADTIDGYVRVWVAWWGGNFLYSLPKNPKTGKTYNPLSLSMRDLQYGASLIMASQFDEDTAHRLFGPGTWLAKRDTIRQDKEKKEANGEKPFSALRRGNKKKRPKRVYITKTSGEIVYTKESTPLVLGHLEINSTDPEVQALVERAKFAIIKELG